jgi:hypothetical protein
MFITDDMQAGKWFYCMSSMVMQVVKKVMAVGAMARVRTWEKG